MTPPQPVVAPVIAYAAAPLAEPDPRSLGKFRLGAGFVIAYMAASLLHSVTPVSILVPPLFFKICSPTLLLLAAIHIAANTRLPSDRAVLRYLLLAGIGVATFISALYVMAEWPAFAFLRKYFNPLFPLNNAARAITIAILFVRLAMLARYVNSPNLVWQFHALAALFVVSYCYVFIFSIPFIGSLGKPAIRLIQLLVQYTRPTLNLWGAITIPFLLPRLPSRR
jgi:hypothetical protein